ncbi:Auxin response factor 10 [Forsythia ovata]|uniref:Auxin response factor 10 n=1 Tax=Forsythia ovata TaxID=205694 RepID=A0ABD1XAW6_9LAMI
MVHMPPVNSKVFYFPQGHTQHTLTRIPPTIFCRVATVKYLADPETDEVYAKIRLIPVVNSDYSFDDDVALGGNGPESNVVLHIFAKTLIHESDANNGGGFSIPRYCVETIFSRLDYSGDPHV